MGRRNYESLAEAAARTHVSTRTLRRWIAHGRLNAYRAGPRLLRIDPEDVDAMMRPSLTRGAWGSLPTFVHPPVPGCRLELAPSTNGSMRRREAAARTRDATPADRRRPCPSGRSWATQAVNRSGSVDVMMKASVNRGTSVSVGAQAVRRSQAP